MHDIFHHLEEQKNLFCFSQACFGLRAVFGIVLAFRRPSAFFRPKKSLKQPSGQNNLAAAKKVFLFFLMTHMSVHFSSKYTIVPRENFYPCQELTYFLDRSVNWVRKSKSLRMVIKFLQCLSQRQLENKFPRLPTRRISRTAFPKKEMQLPSSSAWRDFESFEAKVYLLKIGLLRSSEFACVKHYFEGGRRCEGLSSRGVDFLHS